MRPAKAKLLSEFSVLEIITLVGEITALWLHFSLYTGSGVATARGSWALNVNVECVGYVHFATLPMSYAAEAVVFFKSGSDTCRCCNVDFGA